MVPAPPALYIIYNLGGCELDTNTGISTKAFLQPSTSLGFGKLLEMSQGQALFTNRGTPTSWVSPEGGGRQKRGCPLPC